MYDDLTKAAILSGTDKFGLHDYTPNYDKLFAHLRDKPIRVLEIGVGGYGDDDRGGQSLEVWRDYFPQAEITGIDIQKKTMDLGPRVKILQGSQVDPDFLVDLVAKRGPFDIIVDDGSHRNEHIVESYRLLFPTLNAGGIYVAEDVQTSFHPRFGGSLEMKAPNAVGYFGQIAQGLSTPSDDPLIADIAAMERFHNMIALHKRTPDGAAHSVFDSNRFAVFAGKTPSVTTIGRPVDLPFAHATPSDAVWGKKIAAADLVVATVNKTVNSSALETAFAAVNAGGIMVIRSDNPAKDFGPDAPLGQYIQHRFTMVDHVEIAVHYPDAPLDDLAGQIYGLERFDDAVLLYKSPNRYPSNFAYDASNPQAAAAIARMGAVLEGSDSVGGLVLYAGILSRYVGVEHSADPIHRLTAIGATSREYYQMAGGLARAEKRIADATTLFEAALDKFPDDPQFSVMLAAMYSAQRMPDRALATLQSAYAAYPRARNIVVALTRTLIAKGDRTAARDLVQDTVTLFGPAFRPTRLVLLARLQHELGDPDAARAAVQQALKIAPEDADALAMQDQLAA